eukprot:TRINITY_DN4403_c0_g5_i1.p1 TRINITY_DN4403_c0_g5~~TRINITY_DN4403_c0_g5_i1.p1  ORF type:complete len:205 (-),score=62.59 TRINITY_DN4403_c0_g5_i1:161-775(-)
MMSADKVVEYDKVDPIPFKTTLAYGNNFIINTTQFLNRFSYLCENKLCNVSRQIARLEITMNILEAKLSSIPGLEGITADSVPAPAAAAAAPDAPPPPPGGAPAAAGPPPAAPAAAVEVEEETAAASGVVTYSSDPRYHKFFAMLRMRVPASAIRQKMMMEGVNPDIIDMGNQPSGYTGEIPGGDGGSDSSTDDDDSDDDFDDD